MAKKISMQDIADALNISKNSVSQALSGKPGVSDATRKRIEQKAQELGYRVRKNTLSIDPVSRGTGNIGLIASDYAFSLKSFFGEIYLSIEKEVTARGMNLLIQSVNTGSRGNLVLPSFIAEGKVDGVLILSHISNEYTNAVIATGIPTVMIDHHHPLIHADAILTNNRFGAYTAVKHLLELGHRDIAYVGNAKLSPSYQERLEGYDLALAEHGIERKDEFVFSAIEEDERDVNGLLQGLDVWPTAWFCVNDGFGFFVRSALQQHGISVPDAASVVSFDNGMLSRLTTPKITTMNIDLDLYGRKAVEQLTWRMQHRNEPIIELLLPAELIVRESTAKARSNS
ncbi:transcriptional regulator, LacI family [Fictibacillus enclensis]|uniref:LacI family transcriptional regulator n=1 Tax=Fictibacillus enclensis TaxID=1017270 RepID=A0A0V8J4P4_9BACL|nr:LacI family DNA-binding transcriptional regulator [Fictibacillus enclensis]KSU82055.1 LacI family transcriptional regulator [Fictibacillus enclensis]SCC29628.1 transcriptional regulator, LacI family [Fictibacillus enclensis]